MLADRPTVSIVVLNWNGRKHLTACLKSLMELEYPPSRLQVILCDNGSSDGSADFVRQKFPRVHVVALERNLGFAEGNNRAANEATGEWLGFLNNDMWVEPQWLEHMLASLRDHPRAACLASQIKNWNGTRVDFVGGGVNFQGHGFQVDHGKAASPHNHARPLLFACGGAMLVRRDVFQDVGCFDDDYFAFFEDIDLGWRLNLLGHDVWYVPEAVVHHRHHGTAGKIPQHRLQVLYERNALATIYKCFDEDNLAAVLPAAMLLINERALRLSGVDTSEFDIVRSTPDGEPSAPVPAAVPPGPNEKREPLLARGWRVLRQEGWRMAVHKGVGVIRHTTTRSLNWIVDLSRPQHFVVPGIAISHQVALSEFGKRLESLSRKRAWIQERRRRTDAEILPLFVDPFFTNYEERRYVAFYRWLCRVQGLDRRFATPPD
jgi:GT2 family glycosyltransferase